MQNAECNGVVASQVLLLTHDELLKITFPTGATCHVKKFRNIRTWKEHMSVSSTDIIAPALSNSPQ